MRRFQLFEFEDLPWLPASLRDSGTDYLRFMWEAGAYRPIVPRLRDALQRTAADQILDLCSGGGGPQVAIYAALERSGCATRITLTDKFPNVTAFAHLRSRTAGG